LPCEDWTIFPLVLILAVMLGLPGDLSADSSAGIITKVRGQVTARKTGDDTIATLKVGDSISVGHIVQSAKGAAAQLVFTDDSVAILLPDATLQINQYGYSAVDNRRTAVIKVTGGCARFVLYKMRSNDSRFSVETGHASISAGIADFFVCASPAATEIANIGSPLSVQNSERLTVGRVLLGANQRSVVADKTPPSQPATLTPEQRRKYLKDAEI
jgi:hypothetical protein